MTPLKNQVPQPLPLLTYFLVNIETHTYHNQLKSASFPFFLQMNPNLGILIHVFCFYHSGCLYSNREKYQSTMTVYANVSENCSLSGKNNTLIAFLKYGGIPQNIAYNILFYVVSYLPLSIRPRKIMLCYSQQLTFVLKLNLKIWFVKGVLHP